MESLNLTKKSVIKFFSVLLFMSWTIDVFSASVTGVVVDDKDQPLSFVSVFIAGTSIGTTANIEGYYKLELKQIGRAHV